jgi:hypothetical protein
MASFTVNQRQLNIPTLPKSLILLYSLVLYLIISSIISVFWFVSAYGMPGLSLQPNIFDLNRFYKSCHCLALSSEGFSLQIEAKWRRLFHTPRSAYPRSERRESVSRESKSVTLKHYQHDLS